MMISEFILFYANGLAAGREALSPADGYLYDLVLEIL
jgi:hypothetical protein